MDSTASPAQASGGTTHDKPGPLINRNFALLWLGSTISVIGDFVFDTTLVLWIALVLARGQSWAPLAVSGVFIATSAAMVVVGPVAGVFVDRWNKRGNMLAMDLLRGALVVVLMLGGGLIPLPFLPGGRLVPVWLMSLVFAVVFLINALSQFARPASLALVGDIVPEAYQARAMGFTQSSMSLAVLIGPPLAAPLFTSFGPEWALGINAASYVISFLCILVIVAPPAAKSVTAGVRASFRREFWAGLRYFVTSRVLMVLTVSAMIAMLGAGAINTLDVFFATENLRISPDLYGLLGGAMGLGMVAGSVLAAALAQRAGLIRTLWVSLLMMGVLMVAYGRTVDFIPALVVLAVMGVFQAALNVAAGPIILQAAPRELVGRVSAILNPVLMIASLGGAALGGYIASTVLNGFSATVAGVHFGRVDTIFVVAGSLAVVAALFMAAGMRGVKLHAAPGEAAGGAEGEQPGTQSGERALAVEAAVEPAETSA